MPSASRIGVPWRKRESGVTSSRSMPSADQSRCASSISLSDLEIQTAWRRPLSQLSSRMPATWRPLPAPVPSPRNQPRRKRTAPPRVVARGGDDIEGLVHRPRAGEIVGMGFAGIDDAFELGVRQQAVRDEIRRQMRAVARLGRRDRGHGRRLHQLGRMRLRAGNTDRLKRVFLIKRIGEPCALGRRPVDGLIGEFVASPVWRWRRPGRPRPRDVTNRSFGCGGRRTKRRDGRQRTDALGGTCSPRSSRAAWRHPARCPVRRETRSDRRPAACR